MVQPLSREAQSKLEELGLSEQAYAYVSSQAALLAGQSDGRGEWDDYFNIALSDYRRLVKSFRRPPKTKWIQDHKTPNQYSPQLKDTQLNI